MLAAKAFALFIRAKRACYSFISGLLIARSIPFVILEVHMSALAGSQFLDVSRNMTQVYFKKY